MPSLIKDSLQALPQNLLDLNSSMQELPETHAWIPSDNYPTAANTDLPVPVIDLNDENALELIGHACKTWGIFRVVNHNIKESLLDEMEAAGKRLFSLPMQEKLKAARSPDGVSGYGMARISSFFPKLMWSEGFTIVGSPLEHARQLWPSDYETFCGLINEYEKDMKSLARRLMWLMFGSLGITKDDVKWGGLNDDDFEGGNSALQLNSYPACPDPDRAMGLAAHTDSTILTILHENNTSGLQVFHEGFGWVSVPPLSGALVVNVGDLFHILSNGLYPSVLHRAVVNRIQYRLSIAYLYGPPSSVKVSPFPKLIDHFHPPLFMPVSWSEYLDIKSKYFDKALSILKICSPVNEFVGANDHLNDIEQVG